MNCVIFYREIKKQIEIVKNWILQGKRGKEEKEEEEEERDYEKFAGLVFFVYNVSHIYI